MKILIIGSKGFIGSHCVAYFSKNHEVWQCDVVTDYNTSNYFLVDATNANYNEIFQANAFDVCINCSGAASVPDSIKNPQRDFMLNTVNVFKQLDAIRKYNAECKYINLSSAAVYGNPESLPINENQNLQPISPYGVHKKMAEDVCKMFYDNYVLKTASLRLFSAYGEGLKKQLFWDLHKKAASTNNVSLYGTGNESRDFIHVKDVVNAIDVVIQNATFKNTILNVATGIESEIKEVAKTFYRYYNPAVKIDFQGQNRKGDPINWVADIAQLKALGFKANVDITSGLKKLAEWMKEKE